MIILIHVIVAVLGIILTTFGYFRPTERNVRLSYTFVALTIISGFYLVWSEPAQMLHTCMSGLAYLTVVSVGIFATRRKIAAFRSEQAPIE